MKILTYKEWLNKMSGVDELLEDNQSNRNQYLSYVKQNLISMCIDVYCTNPPNINVYGCRINNALDNFDLHLNYNL